MVEVLGYLPHDQAVSQMKGASMLLLAIPDTPDNKGIVTGKLFEYLAAQKPILALGPKGGDVEILIDKCRAGKLFSYQDVEGMKNYILEIYQQYLDGSSDFNSTGIANYTRKNLTEELSRYL